MGCGRSKALADEKQRRPKQQDPPPKSDVLTEERSVSLAPVDDDWYSRDAKRVSVGPSPAPIVRNFIGTISREPPSWKVHRRDTPRHGVIGYDPETSSDEEDLAWCTIHWLLGDGEDDFIEERYLNSVLLAFNVKDEWQNAYRTAFGSAANVVALYPKGGLRRNELGAIEFEVVFRKPEDRHAVRYGFKITPTEDVKYVSFIEPDAGAVGCVWSEELAWRRADYGVCGDLMRQHTQEVRRLEKAFACRLRTFDSTVINSESLSLKRIFVENISWHVVLKMTAREASSGAGREYVVLVNKMPESSDGSFSVADQKVQFHGPDVSPVDGGQHFFSVRVPSSSICREDETFIPGTHFSYSLTCQRYDVFIGRKGEGVDDLPLVEISSSLKAKLLLDPCREFSLVIQLLVELGVSFGNTDSELYIAVVIHHSLLKRCKYDAAAAFIEHKQQDGLSAAWFSGVADTWSANCAYVIALRALGILATVVYTSSGDGGVWGSGSASCCSAIYLSKFGWLMIDATVSTDPASVTMDSAMADFNRACDLGSSHLPFHIGDADDICVAGCAAAVHKMLRCSDYVGLFKGAFKFLDVEGVGRVPALELAHLAVEALGLCTKDLVRDCVARFLGVLKPDIDGFIKWSSVEVMLAQELWTIPCYGLSQDGLSVVYCDSADATRLPLCGEGRFTTLQECNMASEAEELRSSVSFVWILHSLTDRPV